MWIVQKGITFPKPAHVMAAIRPTHWCQAIASTRSTTRPPWTRWPRRARADDPRWVEEPVSAKTRWFGW